MLKFLFIGSDAGKIAFEDEHCRMTVEQGYHPIIRSLITVAVMIL